MWCSQVLLTPVFPRQCTSQQVHSPLHLQEEALPTRAAKQSECPEQRKPEKKRCHLRIAKTENKKNSNERNGQHQVKELIDKLKGWPTKTIKKKAKQQRMTLNREPKECV